MFNTNIWLGNLRETTVRVSTALCDYPPNARHAIINFYPHKIVVIENLRRVLLPLWQCATLSVSCWHVAIIQESFLEQSDVGIDFCQRALVPYVRKRDIKLENMRICSLPCFCMHLLATYQAAKHTTVLPIHSTPGSTIATSVI